MTGKVAVIGHDDTSLVRLAFELAAATANEIETIKLKNEYSLKPTTPVYLEPPFVKKASKPKHHNKAIPKRKKKGKKTHRKN
jgi:hypothetical protein